jgi:hypothetical protein
MNRTLQTVSEWLETFNAVGVMRDNPAALAKEMETIAAVFEREGCNTAQIEAAFQHIKMTVQSRAWPTPAQVYEALRFLNRQERGEEQIGAQRGNRSTLNGIELAALDGSIIPTARRWLRQFPGLRSHAIKLLRYWEEPLVDDRGRRHEPAPGGAE